MTGAAISTRWQRSSGLAYNGFGQENASMGVDCGDINNDGWTDFFMTSYQSEFPVYYRNLGSGRFEDATQETHSGIAVFPYVNWGNGLIDFDNDGDRDILHRKRPYRRQCGSLRFEHLVPCKRRCATEFG